jgi:hypothetical protein
MLPCQAESLEARLLLTVTAPVSATVIENGTLVFSPTSNNSITVVGIVGLRGHFQVTPSLSLSVSHGTLTLGSTTGLTFTSGSNGTASLTMAGSETNLNAALNQLTYTPATGYTGDDSLVINFQALTRSSATVSLFINSWSQLTEASFTQLQQLAGATQAFDVTLLLPNGDLMLHSAGVSANWFELTPDSSGSYADGMWTQLASMHVARLYFSSDVLPNGDVFVMGGEYASDGKITTNEGQQYSNSAEIYDPATNVWTMVAPDPVIYTNATIDGQTFAKITCEGDQPSEVLPNGAVLVGNIFNSGTEIYTPQSNANGTITGQGNWAVGATKVNNDQSDEESWVKLANGDILNYDIWSSLQDGHAESELYQPPSAGYPTGEWVPAGGSGQRYLSTAATGDELGPALLGVRGGDAMFFGANGRTEIYDPSTNSWSHGPQLPSALVPGPNNTMVEAQLTMGDAPAAVLPNGDDLLALSPAVSIDSSGEEVFPTPTFIYEYDPIGQVFTNVSPPNYVSNQGNINSYLDSMLVLPTGQILLTSAPSQHSSGSLAFYNLAPGDGPNPSWAPTITSFTINANGSYTLTGTQLNGRDEGAAYGDDEQMAENYPVVQLIDLFTGTVYYATTSNWSSTGVATGSTPETVNVTLPPGIGGNNGIEVPFLVFAIADGIPSVPILQFFVGSGFPGQIVASGALPHLAGAGQLPGTGAPAAPGTNDNSSPASAALALSVSNVTPPPASTPELSFDFGSNNSISATGLPAPPNSDQFNAALNNAECIQWAGLNVALDILSA